VTEESITRADPSPPAPRARACALALPYVAIAAGIWPIGSGWLAFILYHAVVLGVLTLTRTWPRALAGLFRPPRDPSAARRLGGLGALAGIAGAALMWGLWPWYAGHSEAPGPALAALGLHGGTWLAFAAYHALVNPVVEEAYWRGAFGEREGILRPSDVAFAGYHTIVLARFTGAGPILVSVVALVLVAAFWRFTYRRTGTLWPAVVAHLVADAGIMLVVSTRIAGP
jgi:membrane protease YdiL (CAAX protease family)